MSTKTEQNIKNHRKRCKRDNTGVIADILEAAERGLCNTDCARAGGIDMTTLTKWIKDDDEFKSQFEYAQSLFRKKNTNIIQEAAGKDWKAAAWLLERRDPENYGRNDKMKLEHSTPEKIEVVLDLGE